MFYGPVGTPAHGAVDYNLLFRWFVGLSPDDPIWDPTVFAKNRERLQEGDVYQKFMSKLLKHQKVKPLLSDEHFSVDGTLIEAWASHKSFRPKEAVTDDDGPTSTASNAKTTRIRALAIPKPTLPQGRRAGGKARLLGHAPMENRHGLAVAAWSH